MAQSTFFGYNFRMKYYHLIGIGGCGMAAIAELLHARGCQVAGSDAVMTKLTESLVEKGINVFAGHHAANVPEGATVVVSSAIAQDNPELLAAQQKGLPIVHRAQMLGEIMHEKRSVVILGSHGKTTTASLLTSILLAAKVGPSYAIGATLAEPDCNAALGDGEFFIAEGDESDASFKYLPAEVAVITNIDNDHLATYDHDIQQLKKAYIDWINAAGVKLLVLNKDDEFCSDISSYVKSEVVWFAKNDLRGVNYEGLASYFSYQGGAYELSLPGLHNIENAMAAILVAQYIGLDVNNIQKGLKEFKGVSRRCQVHGRVIEDYGHHPVEVKASIHSILNAYPDKKVWVVFQPHRFTRTRDCWDQFIDALKLVPNLMIMDIYPASENPIDGVSSKLLCEAMGRPDAYFSAESLKERIAAFDDDDVLLLQGAGDVGLLRQQRDLSLLT